MDPITLGVGIVILTAYLFGPGCRAAVEKPKKDANTGDDLPAEDGGIDGGPSVRDAGEDAGDGFTPVGDAGSDAGFDAGDGGDGSDGGDGGPFTREGIEERWARLTQCKIRGLSL